MSRSGKGSELSALAHHLSTSVSVPFSLPLSPHSTVAPQEQLGIVNGLGDHIAVSKVTWRQKPHRKIERK